ncbi:MFS transporter asaE [Pseudocercospora fuligena]|uniref:MFS transporter asaE n=1 Tax=Pseudocercospora fuligena TaxID=685502 RepID=A0A8H6VR33_9PEZI|nr:MFS transporter asaE [Pseudocercospora fuligena]
MYSATEQSAAASSVEMAEYPATTSQVLASDTDDLNGRAQDALPPTDEGFQAWLALFGSFLSNALIWGLALSFGVLQEYYTNNEPFASHPSGIAAIGTTATGIMYLTMPVFLAAFQRWPNSRRHSLWCSLPIVAIALIGASFTNTVPQLLVCQGIIYAVGGNALVMPSINYINEWFVRKKGLAIGVAIAGDGVGGVITPLILQALLPRVGFRWTLRIMAAIICIPSTPLIFFLKPRVPIGASTISPRIDISFLRHRLFWVFEIFNIVQALGYFLPMNYLPSIAEALNLNSTLGSLTVLAVNLGSVFGCLSVGALVDRFEVTTVILGVSFLSGLAVLVVLGFSITIAPLFIFSLLYGLTASAYSTSWGGVIKKVQRRHEGTDANLVFGLLAAGRGVGSIISGPLSESLLASQRMWQNAATSAYSSQYGPIIIFSGTTALVGGLSWFVRKAGIL